MGKSGFKRLTLRLISVKLNKQCPLDWSCYVIKDIILAHAQ